MVRKAPIDLLTTKGFWRRNRSKVHLRGFAVDGDPSLAFGKFIASPASAN